MNEEDKEKIRGKRESKKGGPPHQPLKNKKKDHMRKNETTESGIQAKRITREGEKQGNVVITLTQLHIQTDRRRRKTSLEKRVMEIKSRNELKSSKKETKNSEGEPKESIEKKKKHEEKVTRKHLLHYLQGDPPGAEEEEKPEVRREEKPGVVFLSGKRAAG